MSDARRPVDLRGLLLLWPAALALFLHLARVSG